MNLSIRNLPFLCLFGLIVIAACKKQDYTSIEELDAENIDAYIKANNLNVEPLGNTGMYYQIVEEGKGRDLVYTESYPIVYTKRSLDGSYAVADTFASASRYMDFLGYFLGETNQGSPVANLDDYQKIMEKDEGLKFALRTALKKTDGKIRILIPSRLLRDGRNGNTDLGIPSNASMDYELRVIDSASVPAYEDLAIQKRIQTLGLNLADFQKTETGIYYKINKPGEGTPITLDSTVTAVYNGYLLNGTVFDQSDSVNFTPKSLVKAWQEILPKIKKGGEVHFFTPPATAYGVSSSGPAPFSSLEFNVTIKDN